MSRRCNAHLCSAMFYPAAFVLLWTCRTAEWRGSMSLESIWRRCKPLPSSPSFSSGTPWSLRGRDLGCKLRFLGPISGENLERVLLQLLLLKALMVVFEERVIKLTIFDILLHACLELGQLLLDCRHLWRRNSNVDLRKRHSVFGFARALGPRLSLGGALLLVVRGLSLSVDSVVRDLASQDALVFLVQVVDVQPIWQIRKIAVHSQRGHIFSGLASILRVW